MATLKFVNSVWANFRATSGLEPRLLDNVRSRPGTVNFELDVQKEHTNRLGILHGGTIASMVDLGGSLAVASHGLFATGVSTDLNVTYLGSGGKIGDKILAEVTCDKFGNRLAYTSIKFTNTADKVVARGSHTNLQGPKKHHGRKKEALIYVDTEKTLLANPGWLQDIE
ncbi:conserved hypothetical protein [Microsporum canis CBS 113480]|uniref:Thioesterase domain-containing protein n=1 Tax=Arthroderma otae (strain ATCC MYA-4605 / CBS 113480) TaxID=554155 RepID=C5FFP3_ARTOC|nr:conserved hypothetical protein [Microsporum canis CBS 113480]EEQ29490.1 conserved hypothetical protein [Microsporum canis CBS 113480]